MTVTPPTTAIDTHKSATAKIHLQFAEFSAQLYYLDLEMKQNTLAEIGHVTVTDVGPAMTEFTAGVSLHSIAIIGSCKSTFFAGKYFLVLALSFT